MINFQSWIKAYGCFWWRKIRSSSPFIDELFVLEIREYKERNPNPDYHPPPGYGLPPGQKPIEDCYQTNKKFALFLRPKKLEASFLALATLVLLLIPSLICIFHDHAKPNLVLFFTAITLLSWLVFRMNFFLRMPKALQDIWQSWPVSRNSLFLSVPYRPPNLSDIPRHAQPEHIENPCHFWNPDRQSSWRFQPLYYANHMGSLQESIYHLALFDLLFDQEAKKPKLWNWIRFVWSPVLILYAALVFSLFAYQALPAELFFYDACREDSYFMNLLGKYPGFFVWMSFIWGSAVFIYTYLWVGKLEKLLRDSRRGEFKTFLDRIPQQILHRFSLLPDEADINQSIKGAHAFIKILMTIALVNLMVMLEIFSNLKD